MDVGVSVELPVPVLPAKALVETIATKAMIPVNERIFFMLFDSLLKVVCCSPPLQQPFCSRYMLCDESIAILMPQKLTFLIDLKLFNNYFEQRQNCRDNLAWN
ncbi:MAG: hypothetical protein Q8R88_10705 [Desulfoprunum sp.]|nr:hypothetical protein [Desulfoprunum sp.]